MLIFAIKSALVLALFYWVFFALLSKETFHRLNRITLLSALALSVLMPLLPHTIELHVAEANKLIVEIDKAEMAGVAMADADTESALIVWLKGLTWLEALTLVYYAGVLIMLLFHLLQAISLVRYMRVGLRHTDAYGNTVILKPGKTPSFSIFRYIIMGIEDYEHDRDSILSHEQAHIQLGHTYDLLLLEAVKTIQWFNPFVWLLGRDLRSIHEYEADMSVLSQGIDATQYQRLLVCKAAGPAAYAMINGFNQSQLITRIIMMNKKQSSPKSWVRYIALLPMCALAFVVSANVQQVPEPNAYYTYAPDSAQDRNPPLVICDGKRIPDINSIDNAKIKSVSILKPGTDIPKEIAEIAKKYPEEAKNGVVVVVLKDGKEQPLPDAEVSGQKPDSKGVYTVVEEQPQFPGGEIALMEYVSSNLRYPESCVKDSIQGRVTLSFVIDKDGTVTDVEEMRSPNADLTKEAIRLVSSMPKWIPGKQHGEAVRVKYVIPITFKMK